MNIAMAIDGELGCWLTGKNWLLQASSSTKRGVMFLARDAHYSLDAWQPAIVGSLASA